MPKSKKGKITPQEQAQSVAYVALFIGLFVAYLWAEAFLALRPHPYHWPKRLSVLRRRPPVWPTASRHGNRNAARADENGNQPHSYR